MTAFIAFYRMCPYRKGASCSGLEEQRAAVLRHIWAAKPPAEYAEIESGENYTMVMRVPPHKFRNSSGG